MSFYMLCFGGCINMFGFETSVDNNGWLLSVPYDMMVEVEAFLI